MKLKDVFAMINKHAGRKGYTTRVNIDTNEKGFVSASIYCDSINNTAYDGPVSPKEDKNDGKIIISETKRVKTTSSGNMTKAMESYLK